MRRAAVLALVLSTAASAAVTLDTGFPVFTVPGSSSTTCTMSVTTTGNPRTLVVAAVSIHTGFSTISVADGSGLTWTQLGATYQVDSNYSVGIFYATAPSNLTSDVVTVTYSVNDGTGCAVWSFAGAGTPTNRTQSHTGAPGAMSATITAGTGSFLIGIAGDMSSNSETNLANTSSKSANGVAFNFYVAYYTTSTVSGSTTYGSSSPTTDNYGMLSAEVPVAGGAPSTPTSTRMTLGVGL